MGLLNIQVEHINWLSIHLVVWTHQLIAWGVPTSHNSSGLTLRNIMNSVTAQTVINSDLKNVGNTWNPIENEILSQFSISNAESEPW